LELDGRSRLVFIMGSIALFLTLSIISTTAPAEIDKPLAEAPLCEITLDVDPAEVEVFPTYEGTRHLVVLAELTVHKYRPGSIRVHVQARIDNEWMVTPADNTIPFDHVGANVAFLPFNIIIPPHTVGPITGRIDFLAYLDSVGMEEEDSAVSNITVMPRSDEYLVNMPSEAMALNGVLDGMVTVYNLHDQELEFHLCALGEWAELMPDLDFQNSVVLAPNEVFETRYHGEVSPDVEEGTYVVEIALWTPGPEGERIIITIREVSILIDWDAEGLTTTLVRFALPLVVVCVLTVAGVAYYVQRRRRSYLEEA
jgi:hypothetical protein